MKSLRSTSHFLLILLLISMVPNHLYGQIPDAIINATRKADAKELSTYFNSKIELVLPQKSGVFSNSQAKLILEDFFRRNPSKGFKIIHQGNRQNSSFAIGKYNTNNMVYRFYFLTKLKDDKTYIHQLRIEKEDD